MSSRTLSLDDARLLAALLGDGGDPVASTSSEMPLDSNYNVSHQPNPSNAQYFLSLYSPPEYMPYLSALRSDCMLP